MCGDIYTKLGTSSTPSTNKRLWLCNQDWFQSAVHILGLQYQCRFWMFEPPGCIGELLMGTWSLQLQSPQLPGQKISSHALCFSSNVQLIPHVSTCYIMLYYQMLLPPTRYYMVLLYIRDLQCVFSSGSSKTTSNPTH